MREKPCPRCATAVDYAEHEAVIGDYASSEKEVRRLRRLVRHLQDQLNESESPENLLVKEVCGHHAKRWKAQFPKSRGVTYAMESTSAVAVRRALRLKFTVDEIKAVIDWVFQSEFHLQKKAYLELDSILKDDKRIRAKLHRIEEETKPQVLWPPVDRILLALRQRGLEWDRNWLGAQEDEGVFWKNVGQCPLCHGRCLRVGVKDNGWAKLQCDLGCDFYPILEALGIDAAELTRPFDPELVRPPAPVALGANALFDLEDAA